MVGFVMYDRIELWPSRMFFVLVALTLLALMAAWPNPEFAHAVAKGDKGYIQEISGPHLPSATVSSPVPTVISARL